MAKVAVPKGEAKGGAPKAPPIMKSSRRRGDLVEVRVGKRYRLHCKIGQGSFGDIYEGVRIDDNKEVVIKLEKADAPHPQLLYEARLCKLLHLPQESPGFPKVFWYGQEGAYYAMVMESLDRDLEALFASCQYRFTLKTVLMLADQMLARLEVFHGKNFVHRDIKPDNFMMGLPSGGATGPHQTVYLIDYGLAKRYRDAQTMQHAKERQGKALTGTARYASLNTHEGREQSRRDDMESLGYMLVYFQNGTLPWQGLEAPTKEEKYLLIRQAKEAQTPDKLCEGLPDVFKKYLLYVRNLGFEDRPDYQYLRKMFRDVMTEQGYSVDYVFDWCRPA